MLLISVYYKKKFTYYVRTYLKMERGIWKKCNYVCIILFKTWKASKTYAVRYEFLFFCVFFEVEVIKYTLNFFESFHWDKEQQNTSYTKMWEFCQLLQVCCSRKTILLQKENNIFWRIYSLFKLSLPFQILSRRCSAIMQVF